MLFNNTSEDASAGTIRNFTLSYRKKDQNDAERTFDLTVPLLTIVPIPYIRIDEMTIDFKAKLTDSIKRETNTSFQLNTAVGGEYSAFWSPVKFDFRVSAAFKTDSSSQAASTRDYEMSIHVRAVQDSMPSGLSKLLDILEDAIKDVPRP